MREVGLKNKFYAWMLNGERLYDCLKGDGYTLFLGKPVGEKTCVETYPHAVLWGMTGQIVPAKNKIVLRREALKNLHYDITDLPNIIDCIDATLCVVAADAFYEDKYDKFGDSNEGFIIIPTTGNERKR